MTTAHRSTIPARPPRHGFGQRCWAPTGLVLLTAACAAPPPLATVVDCSGEPVTASELATRLAAGLLAVDRTCPTVVVRLPKRLADRTESRPYHIKSAALAELQTTATGFTRFDDLHLVDQPYALRLHRGCREVFMLVLFGADGAAHHETDGNLGYHELRALAERQLWAAGIPSRWEGSMSEALFVPDWAWQPARAALRRKPALAAIMDAVAARGG